MIPSLVKDNTVRLVLSSLAALRKNHKGEADKMKMDCIISTEVRHASADILHHIKFFNSYLSSA